MHRPPRDPKEPLFGSRTIALSLLQGISVLACDAGMFGVSLRLGRSAEQARAVTYTTLIIANLCLILSNRSWTRTIVGTLRSHNAALWWVLGGAVTLLGLILWTPFLREMFRFESLHTDDLLLCLGAGLLSILWFEALKFAGGRSRH